MSPDEERYPRATPPPPLPTPPHPAPWPPPHGQASPWHARRSLLLCRVRCQVILRNFTPLKVGVRWVRSSSLTEVPMAPPPGPPESPTNQELNVRSHGAPSLLKGWLLGFPSLP